MKKDGTVEEGLKDETPTLQHRPPCIYSFPRELECCLEIMLFYKMKVPISQKQACAFNARYYSQPPFLYVS